VDFIKVGHRAQNIERTKNLRDNAKSWAQGSNARCQIRVNLFKTDGRWAQISSVGRKMFLKSNPGSGFWNFDHLLRWTVL
jgi:hypothetical protein